MCGGGDVPGNYMLEILVGEGLYQVAYSVQCVGSPADLNGRCTTRVRT